MLEVGARLRTRHALHQANVETHFILRVEIKQTWSAPVCEIGHEVKTKRATLAHSTTVPVIWKYGRPTEVCHVCGELRTHNGAPCVSKGR